MAFDQPSIHFSIIGAETLEDVEEVVPEGWATHSYDWNNKYGDTPIKMIRACMAFRNKHYDPSGWPPVFDPGYKAAHLGDYCWDAGDEYDDEGAGIVPTYRIAQIVSSTTGPMCPQPGWGSCLGVDKNSNDWSAEDEFVDEYIADDYIWLVGNEPDNEDQDFLNGTRAHPDNPGAGRGYAADAETYATFYRYMYDLVDTNIDRPPQLVFCQATFAGYEAPGLGLRYCEPAYDELVALVEQERSAPDMIYALSTHEYLVKRLSHGGIVYEHGAVLKRTPLPLAMVDWVEALQEFEDWAASTEGLEGKPLWLTEFGAYTAWCDKVGDQTLQSDDPGLACHRTNFVDIDAENGCVDDGESELEWGRDVFYGRDNQEGIWGLQKRQIGYLADSDGVYNHHWARAWWYTSVMHASVPDNCPEPEPGVEYATQQREASCVNTAWVWGDNGFCKDSPASLSQAGITLRRVLYCELTGTDCELP